MVFREAGARQAAATASALVVEPVCCVVANGATPGHGVLGRRGTQQRNLPAQPAVPVDAVGPDARAFAQADAPAGLCRRSGRGGSRGQIWPRLCRCLPCSALTCRPFGVCNLQSMRLGAPSPPPPPGDPVRLLSPRPRGQAGRASPAPAPRRSLPACRQEGLPRPSLFQCISTAPPSCASPAARLPIAGAGDMPSRPASQYT